MRGSTGCGAKRGGGEVDRFLSLFLVASKSPGNSSNFKGRKEARALPPRAPCWTDLDGAAARRRDGAHRGDGPEHGRGHCGVRARRSKGGEGGREEGT